MPPQGNVDPVVLAIVFVVGIFALIVIVLLAIAFFTRKDGDEETSTDEGATTYGGYVPTTYHGSSSDAGLGQSPSPHPVTNPLGNMTLTSGGELSLNLGDSGLGMTMDGDLTLRIGDSPISIDLTPNND